MSSLKNLAFLVMVGLTAGCVHVAKAPTYGNINWVIPAHCITKDVVLKDCDANKHFPSCHRMIVNFTPGCERLDVSPQQK